MMVSTHQKLSGNNPETVRQEGGRGSENIFGDPGLGNRMWTSQSSQRERGPGSGEMWEHGCEPAGGVGKNILAMLNPSHTRVLPCGTGGLGRGQESEAAMPGPQQMRAGHDAEVQTGGSSGGRQTLHVSYGPRACPGGAM